MSAPLLVAFDSDETLLTNHTHFDQVDEQFRSILGRYVGAETIDAQLYDVQRRNMQLFGYGAKSFMLSMIETAIQLTAGAVTGAEIQRLLDLGKDLLRFPIEPLPDVVDVLVEVRARGHQLMVLTKGDLFDQESKLARSGLGDFFDYVEIVSEKNEAAYQRILRRHGATAATFVMIGNSLKSDVLPVARLGLRAIHVPYHANWIHEYVPAEQLADIAFQQVGALGEVLALLE